MTLWNVVTVLLFLLASIIMAHRTLSFLRTCLRARATVIKLEGDLNPTIVFQFNDSRTGHEIIGRSDIGMNYKVGTVLDILYSPKNPEVGVKVDSFTGIWSGPILIAMIGCFWLLVSLFIGW